MDMLDFGLPGIILVILAVGFMLLPLILLILFFVYLGGIRNALRDITDQLEQLNAKLHSRPPSDDRPLSRSDRLER